MQGIFQTLVIEDEDTYNLQRCYDIEDEEKEDELFTHIERLGLELCPDCHDAMISGDFGYQCKEFKNHSWFRTNFTAFNMYVIP